MIEEFQRYIDVLPALLDELARSPLKPRSNLDGIPNNGIYVFYEDERPIYVGRSGRNRMKKRIMGHGRRSSPHNTATFAFNIAKKEANQVGIDINRGRSELEKDTDFQDLFFRAKERISRMSVRVIEIEDPITQTLFEVYASMALNTKEYNLFNTH